MDSEKIINLFRAFAKGDSDSFQRIALDTIEDEKKKRHHLLAKQLENILKENFISTTLNGIKQIPPIPRDNEKGFRLIDVNRLYLDWEDIILSADTETHVKQLIEEFRKYDVLATYGLRPKSKVLFYGPPGTGKTLCAKVLSSVIAYFGPNRPPSRSKPATLSEQIGHHRLRFKAL